MTEIKVFTPGETSVVTDMKGHPHYVDIDADGRRYAMLPVETVKQFLESGLPCSLPWRELNQHLIGGVLGPPEKVEVGICIADALRAVDATRPRHPLDRGGIINDTLREMGVRR
jgi:hypothetical protein